MNAEDRTQLDLLEARVMGKLNELSAQVAWFIRQNEKDQLNLDTRLKADKEEFDKRLTAVESDTDQNTKWRQALPVATILFAATAVLSIAGLLIKG